MKLFSPAKINLFLRVLKKREDGYHELASLFQAVSLGDTLHFSLSETDHFTCNDPLIPTGADNLIWKAVALFRKKTALSFGLTVHLDKKIPMQAGIGGGSSNAATTLWALNELHGKPASRQLLQQWAEEIGSDVSFFFSQGTAYCTGRGEKVQNLKPLQGNLWLVKPAEGLSTPLIFKNLDLKSCAPDDPLELLKQERFFLNDLEEPAFKVMPSLMELKKELLSQGFSAVCLTGSGTGILCQGLQAPCVRLPTVAYPLTFVSREEKAWYNALS